ncbi:MAG TPA: hypothetical protein VK660_00835 [Xanthomonadaceae bacterium]|jgi:hypothetical protein|nr:hypothetical protein [Xanthomonadaceae bacterium]
MSAIDRHGQRRVHIIDTDESIRKRDATIMLAQGLTEKGTVAMLLSQEWQSPSSILLAG